MKIKVGVQIKMPPWSIIDKKGSDAYRSLKDKSGTVVNVNYEHKHFTLAYEFKFGRTFRETFKFSDLQNAGESS